VTIVFGILRPICSDACGRTNEPVT
jgi:hypothetical protein